MEYSIQYTPDVYSLVLLRRPGLAFPVVQPSEERLGLIFAARAEWLRVESFPVRVAVSLSFPLRSRPFPVAARVQLRTFKARTITGSRCYRVTRTRVYHSLTDIYRANVSFRSAKRHTGLQDGPISIIFLRVKSS